VRCGSLVSTLSVGVCRRIFLKSCVVEGLAAYMQRLRRAYLLLDLASSVLISAIHIRTRLSHDPMYNKLAPYDLNGGLWDLPCHNCSYQAVRRPATSLLLLLLFTRGMAERN
jgi:hypothetical protein